MINQGGQPPAVIELNPLADEVHVLTACDVALGAAPQPNYTGLPCAPLVTHIDGTLVSASSPANVGETLTAWVFGLGQTNPPASTGEQGIIGAPAAETFNLDFNYSVNALATKPVQTSPDRILIHPLYAGLAPGYVGLYQVNFTVPQGPQNGIALRSSRLLRAGSECATVEPHGEHRRAVFVRRSGHMREHSDPCGLSLTAP